MSNRVILEKSSGPVVFYNREKDLLWVLRRNQDTPDLWVALPDLDGIEVGLRVPSEEVGHMPPLGGIPVELRMQGAMKRRGLVWADRLKAVRVGTGGLMELLIDAHDKLLRQQHEKVPDEGDCPGGCGWVATQCRCTNHFRKPSGERLPVILGSHQTVRLVNQENLQIQWCPVCGSVFGQSGQKKLFEAPGGSKSTEEECHGMIERGKGAFPFMARLSHFLKSLEVYAFNFGVLFVV